MAFDEEGKAVMQQAWQLSLGEHAGRQAVRAFADEDYGGA